jgi:hypothetical protein
MNFKKSLGRQVLKISSLIRADYSMLYKMVSMLLQLAISLSVVAKGYLSIDVIFELSLIFALLGPGIEFFSYINLKDVYFERIQRYVHADQLVSLLLLVLGIFIYAINHDFNAVEWIFSISLIAVKLVDNLYYSSHLCNKPIASKKVLLGLTLQVSILSSLWLTKVSPDYVWLYAIMLIFMIPSFKYVNFAPSLIRRILKSYILSIIGSLPSIAMLSIGALIGNSNFGVEYFSASKGYSLCQKGIQLIKGRLINVNSVVNKPHLFVIILLPMAVILWLSSLVFYFIMTGDYINSLFVYLFFTLLLIGATLNNIDLRYLKGHRLKYVLDFSVFMFVIVLFSGVLWSFDIEIHEKFKYLCIFLMFSQMVRLLEFYYSEWRALGVSNKST